MVPLVAMQRSKRLAGDPQGSSVKVLNAFELPLAATPEGWAIRQNYYREMDEAVRTQARSIVERALAQLRKMENRTITIDGQFIPSWRCSPSCTESW